MIPANRLPVWPTFGPSLARNWDIYCISRREVRDRPLAPKVVLHINARAWAPPMRDTIEVSWCGDLALDSPICHRSWAAIALACVEADPKDGLPFAIAILSDETDASALIAADWLEERAHRARLRRYPGSPASTEWWDWADPTLFWDLPGWSCEIGACGDSSHAGPSASWARYLISRFCIGCDPSAAIGGRDPGPQDCDRCGRLAARRRDMPIPGADR